MNKILEVKNLNFSYKDQKILRDISFEVEDQDYIAIIGPNGSGKTTLIKLLVGLLESKDNSIRYNTKNEDINIGYVPQKIVKADNLFPASVEEIILTGLLYEKSFFKFYTKEDYKRVDEILNKLNSSDLKNKKIGSLSGGQQQRVLLARAMIKNPEILILDEPTSALDPTMTEEFYKICKELNNQGVTIILISHDIKSVEKYVNKVLYLKNEILFFGEYEEFKHSKELISYLGFDIN